MFNSSKYMMKTYFGHVIHFRIDLIGLAVSISCSLSLLTRHIFEFWYARLQNVRMKSDLSKSFCNMQVMS